MSHNPPIADWRGKTVWLVGASSGIGLATAQALHGRGAQVVISARQAPLLEAFCAAHAGAVACPLDVTDAQAVQAAAGQLLDRGPIDMVVYCAGHYKAQRGFDFTLEELLRHQQINYVGALNVMAATLPAILAHGSGHFSLVASVAGYRGLPKSLAYGPTKAALINLAESLYADVQPRGIGVSLVNPGFVQTPLTAQNRFHMPALITPDQAASAMLEGWRRGVFEIHYPKRFTRWMKLLGVLPYAAYLPLVVRMGKEP
jgi:NAD(P)-dependent dehydrogenase (short-subunit alcohol dehydrogenase family)